jgi:hypothetical protein
LASTPFAFVASDREALPFEDQSDLGEYIGFIDIRPEHIETPIAMALLAPPVHMRLAGRTTIMVGDYGPYFGAHSFPCTVYCMHDPKEGGTVCAHACIMMVLGMMLDRGASLDGPFALHYLAQVFREYHQRKVAEQISISGDAPDDDRVDIDPDLLDADKDVEDVLQQLGWYDPADTPVQGATLANASFILDDTTLPARVSTGLDCLGRRRPQRWIRDFSPGGLLPWIEVLPLVHRFGVTGHASGWPPNVNSETDTNRLFIMLMDAYIVAGFPIILFVNSRTLWGELEPEGHTVVVVGISSTDTFETTSLIIHDPGVGPFVEHSAARCLSAVTEYPQNQGGRGEKTCVLFVGDKGIKTHAIVCIQDLQASDPEAAAMLRAGNYRIRLIDKLDVWNVYRGHIEVAAPSSLENLLPPARCWCIDATSIDSNRYVWLYNADESDAQFLGRLHINPNSKLAWWRGLGAENESKLGDAGELSESSIPAPA